MENLDYLCMEYGQKIPESKENETLITKTIGVLQENGPFAMFLFLKDRRNRNRTKVIAGRCYDSLMELLNERELKRFFGSTPHKRQALEEISKWLIDVSKDTDKLFLLKKILEQSLVYARYYSKALPRG